eukprot:5762583-Pleurochrysis_carterae.AAC.1
MVWKTTNTKAGALAINRAPRHIPRELAASDNVHVLRPEFLGLRMRTEVLFFAVGLLVGTGCESDLA